MTEYTHRIRRAMQREFWFGVFVGAVAGMFSLFFLLMLVT